MVTAIRSWIATLWLSVPSVGGAEPQPIACQRSRSPSKSQGTFPKYDCSSSQVPRYPQCGSANGFYMSWLSETLSASVSSAEQIDELVSATLRERPGRGVRPTAGEAMRSLKEICDHLRVGGRGGPVADEGRRKERHRKLNFARRGSVSDAAVANPAPQPGGQFVLKIALFANVKLVRSALNSPSLVPALPHGWTPIGQWLLAEIGHNDSAIRQGDPDSGRRPTKFQFPAPPGT